MDGSTRAPRTDPVRWYTHGWNRDLSWRLIHAVIPRVPRLLRPPIHLATTLVCFAAMPRERRAARLNLARITGRGGLASRLLAFRLFYNFSKFMVGYTDLIPFRPEKAARRVEGGEEAARAIEGLLAEGKGLIVVTLHLGHWEMGLAFLSRLGRKVSVVLRPEEAGPARWEERARYHPDVRTIAAGESAWNGLDLLLALRRGEIVAVQGDRSIGPAARRVTLFGAPFRLPDGPFRLAQASGAPILIICVPIVGHSLYRIVLQTPLRVGKDGDALQAAADEFARQAESIVARHPTQWFNFFELWDAENAGPPRAAAGESSGAGRPEAPES
jgi:KDO2-lipid IV(A) lauroyltransferase